MLSDCINKMLTYAHDITVIYVCIPCVTFITPIDGQTSHYRRSLFDPLQTRNHLPDCQALLIDKWTKVSTLQGGTISLHKRRTSKLYQKGWTNCWKWASYSHWRPIAPRIVGICWSQHSSCSKRKSGTTSFLTNKTTLRIKRCRDTSERIRNLLMASRIVNNS